jgi:hypothetical protein
MSRRFHGYLSFSGSLVLDKIIKWPFPNFALSPHGRGAVTLLSSLNSLYQNMICTNLKLAGLKKNSVFFLYYLPIDKGFPYIVRNWNFFSSGMISIKKQRCKNLQSERRRTMSESIKKSFLSFKLRWAKNQIPYEKSIKEKTYTKMKCFAFNNF